MRIHPEAGQRHRHRQPVQECPPCPWMGLLQAHFKCRIIAVIRHLMEAPILLPQPVPVTGYAPGVPLSRRDQVRLAARARNTQRAYLGH